MRALRGANASAVIATLNPIIRGWAAYYRTVVSSEMFTALDDYLWRLTYKWADVRHPNKPKHWIIRRYFGKFNRSRQRPLGVRRPRQRRLHAQVRLDQRSSGTRWSRARRHPTTPPWPILGRPAATKAPPPLDSYHPAAAHQPSTAAARSAGTSSSTPTSQPQTPRNGNSGWRHAPARRSPPVDHPPRRPRSARRTRPATHLLHARCLPRALRPTGSRNGDICTAREPSGLARAGCRENWHAGSEGAPGAAMRRPTRPPRSSSRPPNHRPLPAVWSSEHSPGHCSRCRACRPGPGRWPWRPRRNRPRPTTTRRAGRRRPSCPAGTRRAPTRAAASTGSPPPAFWWGCSSWPASGSPGSSAPAAGPRCRSPAPSWWPGAATGTSSSTVACTRRSTWPRRCWSAADRSPRSARRRSTRCRAACPSASRRRRTPCRHRSG